MDRIDGEPMEFEWKHFSGVTTVQILDEIQSMMTESKCEPEQFKGRIILMSDSRKEVGRFSDSDPIRNGMEPILTNRMENGRKIAERHDAQLCRKRTSSIPY